jgi:hypothetical protein
VPPHEGELPAAAAAALAPTLTHWGSSRFGEHRRCGRAHALRWREQIVPLRTGPSMGKDYFGLGILIHAATAYVWEGLKLGEHRDWRDVLHAATQREGGVERATHEEAWRLLDAYFAHWGIPDWDPSLVRIVDVERELQEGEICKRCSGTGVMTSERSLSGEASCRTCGGSGMIGGSFGLPYTARLDLVVEIAGTLHVVDTKTRATKLPDNEALYARQLRTRAQFLGQSFLAQKAYGLSVPPPVIVNAIVKTKIPRFGRLTVPITSDDVARWAEWQASASLESDRMNYSQCAPEIGAPCAYLDYCHGSDEQRARYFTRAPESQAA